MKLIISLTSSEHGNNKIIDFTGLGSHSRFSGSRPNTSVKLHNGDTPNL